MQLLIAKYILQSVGRTGCSCFPHFYPLSTLLLAQARQTNKKGGWEGETHREKNMNLPQNKVQLKTAETFKKASHVSLQSDISLDSWVPVTGYLGSPDKELLLPTPTESVCSQPDTLPRNQGKAPGAFSQSKPVDFCPLSCTTLTCFVPCGLLFKFFVL